MNILGDNNIQGSPVHKGRDFRVQFANTPVFSPSDIPAGRSAHIGNGIFRSVCAGVQLTYQTCKCGAQSRV